MAIKLPELPENYRWNYKLGHTIRIPVLKLQKRCFGIWITKKKAYVHSNIWGGEQEAIDIRANDLVRALQNSMNLRKNPNYGIYKSDNY